jgi:DNA repair photolyase
MNKLTYWDVRKAVIRIIPRMTQLSHSKRKAEAVQEKGRKKNYSQFNLRHKEWRKQERLLNTEEINSFLEISIRAAACPMPFNMDIWDGLICPYACVYCYANAFRASLYTAFFDNSKTMGFRHCNPTYYKQEMDKMEKFRVMSFKEKQNLQGINKAFALGIPVRMGIRFEDFLRNEGKEGVSLEMLKYLKEIEYPVMINSKSALAGNEEYVRALADNPAGGAIHITAITSNEEITKALEPGAPAYAERLRAIKILVDSGVRVVARIEPYLFLVNDNPDEIKQYMEDMWGAGVRNITFDTYSYTAQNPGIRQSFINKGYDFDRIFLAGCDSQPLGSLLLGKFMELFREYGFSCSTFDMGNAPTNDQAICCEVGDWFTGEFNYGCTVMAARFIFNNKGTKVSWKEFEKWVDSHGGFLTDVLKQEVKELWNLGGNLAYSHRWAAGLTPCGRDEDGILWIYEDKQDYRINILNELL